MYFSQQQKMYFSLKKQKMYFILQVGIIYTKLKLIT